MILDAAGGSRPRPEAFELICAGRFALYLRSTRCRRGEYLRTQSEECTAAGTSVASFVLPSLTDPSLTDPSFLSQALSGLGCVYLLIAVNAVLSRVQQKRGNGDNMDEAIPLTGVS
jgi:hypothetical protein